MFDLTDSGKDSDDLEENMKEIKQMIDQEKQGSAASAEQPQTGNMPTNRDASHPEAAENHAQPQRNQKQADNAQLGAESVDVPADRPTTDDIGDQDVGGAGTGPLFIRQSKFDDASRMIGQMRQLSREMQQVTQQLSQGVEEDAQTERRARELLKELDDGRRNVQDVVSPQD
jgi:hypothetical protein